MTAKSDRANHSMRSQVALPLLVLTLILCGQGLGGEGGGPLAPPHRFQPAGGWHPYGDGLLHWWGPHCFPCQSAPDDYCRKPLPRVCWPPYPPYYVWGPPEIGYPRNNGFRDRNQPQ